MRRFKSRTAGLILAAAVALFALAPCPAAAETAQTESTEQEEQEDTGEMEETEDSEAAGAAAEGADTANPDGQAPDEYEETYVNEDPDDAEETCDDEDSDKAEETYADEETEETAAAYTGSTQTEYAAPQEPEEAGEPEPAGPGSTEEASSGCGVADSVIGEEDSEVNTGLAPAAATTQKPDWISGGTGAVRDITSSQDFRFSGVKWYYYNRYGLGSWATCTYDAVQEDGETLGVMICLDPKKLGDKLDEKHPDEVHEYTTPMMIKAEYYGTGPGSDVLRRIVEDVAGPSDKIDDICGIVTHVSLSEIYAAIHEADSSMGSVKSSVGDGYLMTSDLMAEMVNRYGNEIINLPVPENYYVYIARISDSRRQDFCFGSYRLSIPPAHLRLTKLSAGPEITLNHACYSLAGAEYGVYRDAGCTEQEALLVTDEEGNTGTIDIEADRKYYVKEVKAPEGYFRDDSICEIEGVESEETYTVSLSDLPGASDLNLRILKKGRNPEGKEDRPLEGTEFTVRYYDGYYSEDDLPEEPKRAWVIKAIDTEEGCLAELKEENLVSGTLYKDGEQTVIPLGTVTVCETKAAPGYINDGEFGDGADTYIGHIVIDEDGDAAELKTLQGKPETENLPEVQFTVYDTREPEEEKPEEKKPEIGTCAVNRETGTHTCPSEGEVTIDDTVSYRDLDGGREYIMSGRLTDSSGGETVTDSEGREITSSKRFRADASGTGSVVMSFTFRTDPSFEGKTLVVFERACEAETGSVAAVHEKTDDLGQTLFFPSVRTSATDQSDADREIGGKGKVTVIDAVRYENLTAGTEYTIKGVLMNRSTGKPASSGGKEIRGEKRMRAEASSGTEEVSFSFDAEDLERGDFVVFEEVYEISPDTGKETMVGSHRDLNDKAQTIYHPVPSSSEDTGDRNDLRLLLISICVSAACIYCAAKLRKE